MIVSPEHRQILTDGIKPFDTAENRRRYLRGDIPRFDRVKNLDKRYRWDLLWTASTAPEVRAVLDLHIYQDAHLDTALRKIVPALEPAKGKEIALA